MRYNYEDIKSFIEGENGKGCTLLTQKEEYIDTKQKLTIKCKCGNTFDASFVRFKNRNKRQCNECSANDRKSKYESSKIEFICEYCGKKAYKSKYEYNLAKKHFCNDECRRGYEKRNVTIYKCEYCGKEFHRSSIRQNEHTFCSKECANKGRSVYQGKEKHPRYNSIKVKCEVCGKEILVSEYKQNNHKHFYCSRECADKGYSVYNKDYTRKPIKRIKTPIEKNDKYIKVKCDYCGREFYRLKSSLGNKCFCNTKCAGKWQSLHLIGENSPSWKPEKTDEERISGRKYKAYEDWRNEVLEKYDYTCIISGQRGGALNVHHLNGYSWDIENRLNPNNGVVLTKELHDEFHKIYGKNHNTLEQFKEFYKNKTNKEFINN